MKTALLAAHWRSILEQRGSKDHPILNYHDWRGMVSDGDTRLGYAHEVAFRMYNTHIRTAVPEVLVQFKPKGKWTAAAKAAIVSSFLESQIVYDADPRHQLWWAMVHCFENLLPFIVIKIAGEYAVALDSEQLRSELKGAEFELIYEMDGSVIPRYGDL